MGIAGLAIPLVFGLKAHVIGPQPTYIVVSDAGASPGGFGKLAKEGDKAAAELIRDLEAGRHPAASNTLVVRARTVTEAKPAGLAARSLVLSSPHAYLRETSVGIVYLSFAPDASGILLGIYPAP